ncbi:MAG: hypothetical protein N2170_02800 [Bacteroidia bacterium]|nr:hypothetical protein [Bacteroidia bacterium]
MSWWYPFYMFFLLIGAGIVPVLSLFHTKVRAWWRARRIPPPNPPQDTPVFWLHCASVGEFEQGRPVLESLIEKLAVRPYVIVTFFSPSGWRRYQQSYPVADWIGPAPLDLPWIVRMWVQTIHPTAVFFVKYDLWPNFLRELYRQGSPCYLLAAHVEPLEGVRWWWRRQLLPYMRHIFVQTAADQLRLSMAGFPQVTVAGDSRLVRVRQLVDNWLPVSGIAEWVGNHFCIIAGSIWEADVRFLARAYEQLRGHHIRWILVPHEVSSRQIEMVMRFWPVRCAVYSQPEWDIGKDTLIVDTMGLLAYLYAYAHVAWVGGGFGAGIHNILEAIVYKKPVFFGPNYADFSEARELIRLGAAESCKYPVSFSNSVRSMIKDKRRIKIIAEKIDKYIGSQPDTPAIVWSKLHKESWLAKWIAPTA